MCISAAMMVAYGMQAGTAIQQGRDAQAYAEYQGRLADRQASIQEGEGRIIARKTREAGRKALAAREAEMGASGLDINSVSFQDGQTDLDADFESDALAAIYSGRMQGQSSRAEGAYSRAQGNRAARTALYSGAATAMSGWTRVRGMQAQAEMSRQRRELAINRSRG